MEPDRGNPEQETFTLEGTYAPEDMRAFSAFLAGRVAGIKLWTLGAFMLLPLLYAGNLRQTWPLMAPLAVVLLGFLVLMRFVLLPRKLYRTALRLPGVFEPRRITITPHELSNASEAGGLTIRLAEVQEVITTPAHLFVMVTPKQGVPIPRSWLGALETRVYERIMLRCGVSDNNRLKSRRR